MLLLFEFGAAQSMPTGSYRCATPERCRRTVSFDFAPPKRDGQGVYISTLWTVLSRPLVNGIFILWSRPNDRSSSAAAALTLCLLSSARRNLCVVANRCTVAVNTAIYFLKHGHFISTSMFELAVSGYAQEGIMNFS